VLFVFIVHENKPKNSNSINYFYVFTTTYLNDLLGIDYENIPLRFLLPFNNNGAFISKSQLKDIIRGSDNVNNRIVKINIQKMQENKHKYDKYAVTDIQPIQLIVNKDSTSKGGRTSGTRKLYNHKYKRGHKKTHRKHLKRSHRKGIKKGHKRSHKK
jgi:hypothetical protein